MLIFEGDNLLVRDEIFDFPDLPFSDLFPGLAEKSSEGQDAAGLSLLRDSRDLPAAWQDLTPWCEVRGPGAGLERVGLRELWRRWGDKAFAQAGTAYQYMNWLRQARFCSRCAAPLSPREEDKGLVCQGCGQVTYAPLHPAVIVAVERDGKLLLAHNARMPTGRYSILAGFVEPGESLEQTIEREIMEEVGIEVEDIRYFGSQSWPFPCSLMLGFSARWKRGELRPDGVELNDAGWFSPDKFPDIPPGLSISRKLIDDFARRIKKIKK